MTTSSCGASLIRHFSAADRWDEEVGFLVMDADAMSVLILTWSCSFPHLPRCPIMATVEILHQKLNRM